MANPEHLKIFRKGYKVWNLWRELNPNIRPQLSRASFRDFDFDRYRLDETNFTGANLQKANLVEATFYRANLSRANLDGVKGVGAALHGAILQASNLAAADFSYADLSEADLSGAQLEYTLFCGTPLRGAILHNALVSNTHFLEVDLSETHGLDSIRHEGPSNIDINTLYFSKGKIPDKFLRDAGVPEALISYLPSLIAASQPIQWHSCFISYSTKDEGFAQRLHARMRQAGLRVWFASEDMKGGDHFFEQIERAIQLHDRLLLVLSEDSIQSKWVEREIRKTRKVERAEKRRKLFPIRLVDMQTVRGWQCLDSDTGEDLAEEVRKYHIPDFSNWKNHDAFETAFARLEKDLRTSIGK